jgi:predicted extracellular nuclease
MPPHATLSSSSPDVTHSSSAGTGRSAVRRRAAGSLLLAALALLLTGCGGTPPAGTPGPGDDGGAVEAAIPEIQGAAHVSPLRERRVRTEGVVTASVPDGFYLQDPAGDGDPATSDAVFVRVEDGARPATGDRVRVRGTVREPVPGGPETANLTVTTLEAREVEELATGASLPDPVTLGADGRIPPQVEIIGDDELPVDLADPEEAAQNPFDPGTEGIDFYESLEAMRVSVPSPVAVSPSRAFSESGTEIFTLVEEGAHISPDDARTDAGGIRLQPHPDNRGDHNPERVQVQVDPDLTPGAAPVSAVGATLSDVTGVLGYSFGNFEVLATGAVEVSPSTLEKETTGLTGGPETVTLATYNVLNLNPLPGTSERMARIGEHVVEHLGSPDILALQEIQDENGTRGGEDDTETDATPTLRALADAVEAAGGPRYEFFDVAPAPNSSGGVPGGNIRNAFLYDPGRVSLRDSTSLTPAELSAAGAPDPDAFEGSRDPLVATFSFQGRELVVVNNHFSSRFGSTPVFGAVHPFRQAAEDAREAQARALNAWVRDRLATDPGARIAVVGDLNTFEFTDDLTEILPEGDAGPVLHNLAREIAAPDRYSFVFQGNSQLLDHVFVTGSLEEGAGIDVVHVNADFPEEERASDHDPLVARLRIF